MRGRRGKKFVFTTGPHSQRARNWIFTSSTNCLTCCNWFTALCLFKSLFTILQLCFLTSSLNHCACSVTCRHFRWENVCRASDSRSIWTLLDGEIEAGNIKAKVLFTLQSAILNKKGFYSTAMCHGPLKHLEIACKIQMDHSRIPLTLMWTAWLVYSRTLQLEEPVAMKI